MTLLFFVSRDKRILSWSTGVGEYMALEGVLEPWGDAPTCFLVRSTPHSENHRPETKVLMGKAENTGAADRSMELCPHPRPLPFEAEDVGSISISALSLRRSEQLLPALRPTWRGIRCL